MSDYKTDADWHERDRKHLENLKFLTEYYGGNIDTVMSNVRSPGIRRCERVGTVRLLPSAQDYRNLTDPELAELVVLKLSAWDELEDGSSLSDLSGSLPQAQSVISKWEKTRVFDEAIKRVPIGQPGAITTLDTLEGAFRRMKAALSKIRASKKDRGEFIVPIEHAISVDSDLKPEQRKAVMAVLRTVFDEQWHDRPAVVDVVNATFLSRVRF
jgi:hypothetical protein